MPDRVYNVLFLCTGNSARSILGEAILNHVGQGRFQAYSAGSTPRGSVHPMTLETLTKVGIPAHGLRSKAWDEFAAPNAPKMDSSSRSATTLPAKSVRSGPVSR